MFLEEFKTELTIITDMFDNKKMMNVAELTSTFTQKELSRLEKCCFAMYESIQLGIKDDTIHEHFSNPFQLMAFVSFLQVQGELMERAMLYNEGIHLMNMTTFEGVETMKLYCN